MSITRAVAGVSVSALLGLGAMAAAPPVTFTYGLINARDTAPSRWLGFLALFVLLGAAGLLARLLFKMPPWILGPSTVAAVGVWYAFAAIVGEDATDYRAAWLKALLLLATMAVPGTLGATVPGLVTRCWRLWRGA
jgi:hypothetical protein